MGQENDGRRSRRSLVVRLALTLAVLVMLAAAAVVPTAAQDAGADQVVIRSVDQSGNLLPGSCLVIDGDAGSAIAGGCDGDNGTPKDGIIVLPALAPGSYAARETVPPAGYVIADPVAFTVFGGGTTETMIAHSVGGTVTVNAVDQFGQTLLGTCFRISRDVGGTLGDRVADQCDGGDGVDDGVSTLTGLGATALVLTADEAPVEYVPQGSLFFQGPASGGAISLTFTFTVPTEPAPGGISVSRVANDTAEYLPGACFRLYSLDPDGSSGDRLARVCDGDDGVSDGTTTFTSVAPGTYLVVETRGAKGYYRNTGEYVTVYPDEQRTVVFLSQKKGRDGR